MGESLEQVEFLDNQLKAKDFVFGYIEVITAMLKALRKHYKIKSKNTNRSIILTIENYLAKLEIFVRDFNKGDFLVIMRERTNDEFYELLTASRRINKK